MRKKKKEMFILASHPCVSNMALAFFSFFVFLGTKDSLKHLQWATRYSSNSMVLNGVYRVPINSIYLHGL